MINKHHNRFQFPIAAVILIVGLMAPPHAPARVSWRWGATSQSSKALSSSGGTSVYQAPLNINGAKADLSVFSFELPCESLVSQLASLFKDSSISYRRGTMAFFFARDRDTVIRLVLIQPAAESHTLVVKIEQSANDYESSIKPPEKHLLPEMPEFPSSTPLFYASNSDTDLQMASCSSTANTGEIKSFYSQSLTAQGWQKPLDHNASLLLFIRGNAVCMVMTDEATQSGSTVITLLHKTHGVK